MGFWGKVRAILFLILFCLPAKAHFKKSSGRSGGSGFLAIHAGAHMNNIQKRYSVSDANRGHVNTILPYLRLHPGLYLGRGFYFEPSIGFVTPWRSGHDGTAKTITIQTSLDLALSLFSFFRFRAGLGLHWDYMFTKASTVRLSNGDGESDFYLPGRTSSAYNVTLGAGIDLHLFGRFSLHLDGYTLAPFDDSRRNYKAAATVGYRL